MPACWSDGTVTIPAPNDPWLTLPEIQFDINYMPNVPQNQRAQYFACLEPHWNNYYAGIDAANQKIAIGPGGLIRFIYELYDI